MSYTQADLDAIRTAMRKLAIGDRVGEFQHGGTRIKYGDVTMKELEAYEKEILRHLSPRRRVVYIGSDKGLT
ncbi:gpW family head-tail joining protein [Aeromonas veronii]|uniref:gpW family head-tail joining protein n=1 Tax=Aeromonas veronii TaxID=654 RepID=UPI0018F17CC8|nr:gpW family head-tail joining protein [Aeromonas veronii]MBJ7591985.1 hypothetical protein [Aeromonas veronii]